MVAVSRGMAQLRNFTGQVAQTDLDISIKGENGTGKEMLARGIHQQSKLYAEPFIIVFLGDLLENGSLKAELFHRLNSFTLRIPPSRERREDIPALFARFVRDALAQTGKKRFEMSAATRKHPLEHDWPGNAREPRN